MVTIFLRCNGRLRSIERGLSFSDKGRIASLGGLPRRFSTGAYLGV